MMKKLWDKDSKIDKRIEKFTVGKDYVLDQELIKYDCLGSIAHCKMLGKIDVLDKKEVKKIIEVLKELIKKQILEIQPDQEDCHTAIENYLTEKLGDIGKKIHTARSRNDQILTALRLYYLDKIDDCKNFSEGFTSALKKLSLQYKDIPMPGYTHMRKAMPSSLTLWCQAFIDSAEDNISLLNASKVLIDQSPLGTAAGYGVPMKLDRQFTSDELGFSRIQTNPIYAQISRGKFELTLIHCMGQIMFDLNKLASDLILFSMPEFGFFNLPEDFCTGSSIMPQKQNPDVLEILRGKYHSVKSCEIEISGLISDLGTGFHRDFQLTKEPTMKGIEITLDSLEIASLVIRNLSLNTRRCQEAMTDEIYATERAYALVEKGMPFREAYKTIAKEFFKEKKN
ncbi:MAG: argininosuccinate lyase [Candidatus Marinimicrobia bacterium]|nr:argininosuccinate lyase [Candidatus Neomarinimicrobiota bacterium]|tara:strand:- start:41220 stop:42410 length:1191 start_codon:yes stop_codon:yes gene_type:complete